MRIAICDDSREFLQELAAAVGVWQAQFPAATLDAFEDGDSLLKAHAAAPYDIILMDVVMPLLNGIDTAREIRQNDKGVKIVFLTSSPEFAVDSYSVKASNYLLKPLCEEKLHSCLNELWDEICCNERSINVKSANAVHRVQLRSIAYIEAQNKHVLFSLTSGSVIQSAEPLYSLETKLSPADGFFKCSRSYLVNLHQIESYTPKEITMRSGCRIPISRNRHKEFEEAYFSVIFGKAGERL